MEPESPRDGRALREVAKLAAPVAGGLRKQNADHSGLVDLAALMAQQPNWLDDALARAKASSSSASSLAPLSLAPPAIGTGSFGPTTAELTAQLSALALPRKHGLTLILASSAAGLLVLAACGFAWKMTRAQAATASLHAAEVAAAAPRDGASALRAARSTPVEEPSIPPPPAAADGPAQPAASPGAVVPAAPAAAVAETTPPDDVPTVGRHGKRGRREARRTAQAARNDAPEDTAPQAAPAPAPRPAARPGPSSPLDAALRASIGPAAAEPPPAAPAPKAERLAAAPKSAPDDGRPERPSGSAVTSALTSALSSARGCLASDAAPSRALVTFGSDGNVRRVDVSGPAASDGKAGQCLKSAFGRAHVPPFSSSNYSAGVTVRPR